MKIRNFIKQTHQTIQAPHHPWCKVTGRAYHSLEKHFDIELTDKAVMSKTFLELCVMGNIDCDEPDMIDFEIYRVVRNSKSEALYACEKYDLDDDDIFIIFEEHNNFFISNSQIVEMLLIIKEGVSAEDYENETPEFLNYIRVCRYFCQTNFLSSTRLLHMTSSI